MTTHRIIEFTLPKTLPNPSHTLRIIKTLKQNPQKNRKALVTGTVDHRYEDREDKQLKVPRTCVHKIINKNTKRSMKLYKLYSTNIKITLKLNKYKYYKIN